MCIARSLASLGPFTVALGLHFVVNDFGLVEHDAARYESGGRWLLAGGYPGRLACRHGDGDWRGGGGAGVCLSSRRVVLNVLKEELPDERESRFGPFSLGLAGYAALLLAL